MAELMINGSTGAMVSLLGKLGTMLSDEYKLLKNIREDIKFLKDELEAMHTFLIMMANMEKPDEQAKLRAHAVREMSYEIEDNIDKFMILVEHEPTSKSDGFMKVFNKSMKKIIDIKIRHKIAKDVKDMKSQVKEINKRYTRYKIEESSRSRNEKVDPRLCAIFKEASELVGIDGPRDELVKWLSNKEGEMGCQHKVLSIVGYGGLGKTTLAKQVYDKLGTKYECRAFVSISRSPDMMQILGSILSQLCNQDYDHAIKGDLQLIINQIRDFLKDKRYFIIIDDIWDEQTWRTLDCALFKNGCGSVIMTTTRIHDVAKSCCSQGDLVYQIQPLNVPDSKRLFFKRIFGCEENCPSNLKEASEDILKKCGGLPLAINAISSLLATGKTKKEWDRVRGSIGFAQVKNSDIDAMNYILSLSFFDLPLHLRGCLLYLTMFPEDSEIERYWLVQIWISEGFIHCEDRKNLVKLGDTYFHELVNRSLIQPVDISDDGEARSCRVHDTVLDFLRYKSTEENFCTLLCNPSKPDSRVRRLSLMGNEDQGSVEQLDLSHARSLIAFPKAKHFPSLVKSNALRVLDLHSCRELKNHHVKDIGRLFQLRYLNIFNTRISELPRQIGDLKFLETIVASVTDLVELPASITRLQRLARLCVPAETKFPDGVGNMKNLQVLGDISPLKQSLNFLEELGKLTNLRKLRISWNASGYSGKSSFLKQKEVLSSSLRKLETCKLATTSITLDLTENDAALIMHPYFPVLTSIRSINIHSGKPRWISKWLVSVVNLERLSIGNLYSMDKEIEQQDVEIVGSIPTLLEFDMRPFRGPIIINRGFQLNTWPSVRGPIIISKGFQRLHKLQFIVTHELMFETGALPNLKNLVLFMELYEFKSSRSGRAGGFNFGIHHLSSLALVTVDVNCRRVSAADVEAAEGAFEIMADAHPNCPTLEKTRDFTWDMIQDDGDTRVTE